MKESGPIEAPGERPGSAVGKAFLMLEVLVAAGRPLSLLELSEGAGLPKPSAHRMLLQLEALGAVKRDPEGRRYGIGDRLARLSLDTLGVTTRRGSVRDILAGLVDRVNETCNLGVLDGNEILYLERVECRQALRLHLQAGSRVALHATAVGKLMLAFAEPGKRARLLDGAPLMRLTANTLSREALIAELATIRAEGVSINREESTLGLIGVAVPVAGPGGAVIAGLAIHAPVSRFDEAAARAAVPVLEEAAVRVAATLGDAPSP